nr:insulinase family protein [Candidatus Kapabacteria bacterium]
MKNIVLLLILFILSSLTMSSKEKIDVTKKPTPLEAKEFTFPKYTEQKLKNGIKVFVIEDAEQPIVSFSILIPGGSSVDGSKAGIAEFVAGLLTKGAGKRNALDIANTLDGVGASISASASADNI